MNRGECGMIGECSDTVYIYLVEVVDEVFGVVVGGALVLVSVLGGDRVAAKYAKPRVRVRVVVLTAA